MDGKVHIRLQMKQETFVSSKMLDNKCSRYSQPAISQRMVWPVVIMMIIMLVLLHLLLEAALRTTLAAAASPGSIALTRRHQLSVRDALE